MFLYILINNILISPEISICILFLQCFSFCLTQYFGVIYSSTYCNIVKIIFQYAIHTFHYFPSSSNWRDKMFILVYPTWLFKFLAWCIDMFNHLLIIYFIHSMVLPNYIWFCYILTANIFKFLSSHKYYWRQIYLSRYIHVFLYLVLSNWMLQYHVLPIFTQSLSPQFVWWD